MGEKPDSLRIVDILVAFHGGIDCEPYGTPDSLHHRGTLVEWYFVMIPLWGAKGDGMRPPPFVPPHPPLPPTQASVCETSPSAYPRPLTLGVGSNHGR